MVVAQLRDVKHDVRMGSPCRAIDLRCNSVMICVRYAVVMPLSDRMFFPGSESRGSTLADITFVRFLRFLRSIWCNLRSVDF